MPITEKQIAINIASANGLTISQLGLRFDKVVIRLFENLRVYTEHEIPEGKIILMTLTAPIKLPAKTQEEIKRQIKDYLEPEMGNKDRIVTIFKNKVRLRIIDSSLSRPVKFISFVHNPDSDSKKLLDMATIWILKK